MYCSVFFTQQSVANSSSHKTICQLQTFEMAMVLIDKHEEAKEVLLPMLIDRMSGLVVSFSVLKEECVSLYVPLY